MNLDEEILKEHSKAQALRIAAYIGEDIERFDQLMQHFLFGSYRITQRASWPVSFIVRQYPQMIIPYLPQMLHNLKNPVHDAVKRTTVRIFQDIDLPEELLGEVADICFEYLTSASVPVAIKVFSMTALYKIATKEPDLKREIQVIIEDQMPFGSAGFRSRGSKILAKLTKMTA